LRRHVHRADDVPLPAAPEDDVDQGMPAAAPIGVASVRQPPLDSWRQALIQEARTLRANKRTGEAIFKLESALLNHFPGDGNLHAELHAAYRKAGDPYATLAHGQQWVASLVRAGRMRDALQALGELHAIDEDFKLADGDAAVPLAKLAMQDRALELAVGLVDGFDQRFPGHPEMPVMYFLGARLLSEHWRRHAQAAQMIRSIVAHFADHPIADDARAYLVALEARIEAGKG
jgi:hypothetical protein